MKKLLLWSHTYLLQIGTLSLGLLAAIIGAKSLAASQGKKSAELDIEVMNDVFAKAAAHNELVSEVNKAKCEVEKAKEIHTKLLSERAKLISDLKSETKGKKKADIIDYINRVE